MKNLLLISLIVLSTILITACSQNEEEVMIQNAVAIEAADECHLCGMIIVNFSGPKGELYKKGVNHIESNKVHKFCSTRDMFSFYLDPENKRNVTTMLVHDMSKMPWDTPKDEFFIDAKSAWFVHDSSKTGAMGKTLASFSTQSDAQAFAKEFGGSVLSFEEVGFDHLM